MCSPADHWLYSQPLPGAFGHSCLALLRDLPLRSPMVEHVAQSMTNHHTTGSSSQVAAVEPPEEPPGPLEFGKEFGRQPGSPGEQGLANSLD